MAAKFASEKNVKFMLYEVHDLMSLTKMEYYSMHNKKAFDMIPGCGHANGQGYVLSHFQGNGRSAPGTGRRHRQGARGREKNHEGGRRRRLGFQPLFPWNSTAANSPPC